MKAVAPTCDGRRGGGSGRSVRRARERLLPSAAISLTVIAAQLLSGCQPPDEPHQTDTPRASMSPQAMLGEQIFHDPSLSAGRNQSCASCHVPAFGHAQDNGLAAQLGGASLSLQGSRVSPSLRYLGFAPPFSLDSGGVPQGGLFWDGRAATLADQAGRPFLNPVEMALASKEQLASRLAEAAYAQEFVRVFGAGIFERPDDSFIAVTQALARFQLEDPRLQPFSSRYDVWLRGGPALAPQEQRGLAVFNDVNRGNCAACHPSVAAADGTPPLFTNFSYHALGLPRNRELAANADPSHHDMGLCAREGGDLAHRPDLCGKFKVPSLRNVALRLAFFHNGHIKTLEEAVRFYAQRDSHPERFYPPDEHSRVIAFADLPANLRGNVLRGEAPYVGVPGGLPSLSEEEVRDLVSFLGTLTDEDIAR